MNTLLVLGLGLSITFSFFPKMASAKNSPPHEPNLSCSQGSSGHWFLVNISNGETIGDKTYGATKDICSKMAATRHGDVVCAWNGFGYQPHNIHNNQGLGLQDPKLHYAYLSSCAEAVAAQIPESPIFCGWTGQTYGPYNKSSNRLLGGPKVWNSVGECVRYTAKNVFQSLTCGWDQGAAYAYDLDGAAVTPKFESYDDCLAFFSVLRNQFSVSDQFSSKLKSAMASASDVTAIKNGKPDASVGFKSWKTCEIRDHAYHLTKSHDGYLTPECSPDTLYSWGNYVKIQALYKAFPDGRVWSGPLERALFTTSSAAGTFGYGMIPIRIKLKPNVRFKLFVNPSYNTCDALRSAGYLPANQLKDTIISRIAILSTESLS